MRPETGILTTQGPVARIRNDVVGVCGTGLLMGDRHVMTCAHVIDDAVPGRMRGDATAPGETETVTLDLPFLDRRGLTARVVAWHPMVDDVEGSPVSDIAVLELDDRVPGGLDPREAVLSEMSPGAAFTTWGFPRGMDGGAEAQGELRMRDAGGWRHIQDTQDHGYFVEPGFSGAPLFDAGAARHGARKLLGMVVAADRDDKKRLAFVIPTPTLGRSWPLLARPYKGLDAFEAEDADLFFGRQEKVEELAAKVARRPFVALIGPSGSGKSSLVRAGLVPRLRGRGGWATATFKPRSNPLYSLAEALASLSPGRAGDGLAQRATELADRLQVEPRHVLDYVPTALRAIPGAERLLLVVDQFEELFTLTPDLAAIENPATPHGAFAAVLDLVGAQPPDEGPIRVVATLRADFTGHALRHAVFERLMTDADVFLGPMTPADLTDAVSKPAERFDVVFDPGLVSEIVATMRDSRGGLPLMQFALDRLWQAQNDRRLTRACYTEMGGVEGALNDHAEAFRAELPAADQEALRRVMTRLVNLADPGAGSEDTRAVATRDQIGETDWSLVGRLAKARLVTTGGAGGKTGTETAEIAHEALIRAWGTLRAWLDEDRTFGLWRQRLSYQVRAWNGKREDALLRGELLAEAAEWKKARRDDLNDTELAYIDAGIARRNDEEETSKKRDRAEAEKERKQREERLRILEEKNQALANSERQQKRFVRRLAASAALLVLGLFGVGYFGWSATIAQGEAQRSTREALGRQLSAEARLTLSEIPGAIAAERAAAMAIEAWHRHQSSQAYQVAAQSMRELPIARFGHDDPVSAVAFSPDGTRLGTGSGDGTARILDAATGDEIARIEHGSPVYTLAFSPDGTRLATGSDVGAARILDAGTGEEIVRIEHDRSVWNIGYSPDGTRLFTSSDAGVARIFDAANGDEIARIEHGASVNTFAYSPDGTRLATSSQDSIVRILDAATGEELASMEHGGPVLVLVFNPDSTHLATGSGSEFGGDRAARIFDAATGDELASMEHGHPVLVLAYSPDGTRLATGGGSTFGGDGTARILDARTADEIARFEHGGFVGTLAFSLDGTRLATGSRDGLRIFDAAVDLEGARIEHGGAVKSLAFSADGTRLAAGSSDGTARILDAGTRAVVARIEYGGPVRSLAFSPNGTHVATVEDEHTARILDAATGEELARIEHGSAVRTFAFSADGTRLATSSRDGAIRTLDATTGEVVASIAHGGPVRSLAFSPDGTRIATGSGSNFSEDVPALVLDAATGEERARIEYGGEVRTLAFSPDGTRIATGSGSSFSSDRAARILDAATGEELARIEHGGAVTTLAFSLDSTRLATGSSDGTVRIINAATGEELSRIEHGAEVTTLAFSADDTRLATGSEAGIVRIFDVDPATVFRRLCAERAGRNLTREEWRRYIGGREPWRETCPEWRTVDEIFEDGQAILSSQ